MTGASIKATLELWASPLADVKARMRPLFSQKRVAVSAGLFLDGVLGTERRKTRWMRAEASMTSETWRCHPCQERVSLCFGVSHIAALHGYTCRPTHCTVRRKRRKYCANPASLSSAGRGTSG